jgi:hypothetical protein
MSDQLSQQHRGGQELAADAPAALRAATLRALLVAAVISLLVSAWVKQSELVTLTSQVSESTPPIAAILSLLLLSGTDSALTRLQQHCEARRNLRGIARLCKQLRLTRGEIFVVFVFVAVTAAMPGVGLFRQVMPCLMVTQYFGMPSDHLAEMATGIPRQWAPNDPDVARVFWEGGNVEVPSFGLENIPIFGRVLAGVVRFFAGPLIVPWRYWMVPFLLWTAYLSMYFIAAFCLVTLFRRVWEDDERLTFPVASIPVETLRPESGLVARVGFFRDPLVWAGLSLAVLYNTLNAIHVFYPGIPALGISYPLGSLFTESPWDTMRGLAIYYKPEILGIGYLVPSDVLFSIWFFTIMSWLIRPFAKMVGYMPSGFPFMGKQAMGAFVVLGIYFIYQARTRLADAFRKALGGNGHIDDSGEPLPLRVAVFGAVVGILVVFLMPIAFGVQWWAALMYFGIMFLVLIVYCRNRAEMGFPIVWGYPLYRQRAMMVDFLGSAAFLPKGNPRSFTLLTMFSWLQRSVNQAITSTGQEAYVAAHRLGESRRTIAQVFISALVFGIVVGLLVNLVTYYEYGGLVLSSPGGIEGGQMTQEVLGQFRAISQWLDQPQPPNTQGIAYTVLGAALASAMILGRRVWPRFRFHPAGYALALCHDGAFMLFPAFLLWVVKTITLHLGGIGTYRRIARGFLAFTLGHFLSVGVWSLIGLYAGEWVRRYIVWFL